MEQDNIDLKYLEDTARTNTIRENIGDVIVQSDDTMSLNQTNIIHYESKVESIVVEKDKITKIRNLCLSEKKQSVPKTDICLSLASLFAGAFFSALLSKIPLAINLSCIFFYFICLPSAVGMGVSYFFLKKNEVESTKNLADNILEYLPKDDLNDGGDN